MRRSALIFFLMGFVLTVSIPAHSSSLDEVIQSRHNLLVPSLSTSSSCTVCHTDAIPWQSATQKKEPANAAAPEGETKVVTPPVQPKPAPPLWGSKEAKPYNISATLSQGVQPYNHPTGSSLTCLACHDGALGKDMHGINVDQPRLGAEANVPWNGTAGQRGAPPLSRVDHPISVLYPRKPNGHFVPLNPSVTFSRYWALPDRHPGGLTLPTAGTSSYLDLPEGKASSPETLSNLVRTTSGMVQCDSCHNPHSEKIRPFLRVPSATLCLVCHDR
jgi:predicted CXXCH cytochrome family protein